VLAQSIPIFSFEASQSTSIWTVMRDWDAMTLPIATLTLIAVAAYSRYMRSSSMDVLAQDYITVARAKGLPQRLVLLRHLVRNASLPMVTLIDLSLPVLLAGDLITESLFNYQGLGLLFFESLQKVDYPVLLAYTLASAVLVVIGNLIADIRADHRRSAHPAGLTGGRRQSWRFNRMHRWVLTRTALAGRADGPIPREEKMHRTLADVKLVRPRRCAAAGGSSLTPGRAAGRAWQLRGRIQKNSQPRRQQHAVTGLDPYALLTIVALTAADGAREEGRWSVPGQGCPVMREPRSCSWPSG
jgi:binding-protein-dependent transport system inner membrane component